MKKKNLLLCIGLFLLLLFVVFTVLLKTVDVAAIGPVGSEIGFSSLNGAVRDALPFREGFYRAAEYVGYAALVYAAAMAICGLYQWISRRSLAKVDREVMVLGALYLAMAILYLFFLLIPVNLRPVLMPGELEAESSYPSSHTVLGICISVSGMMMAKRYLRKPAVKIAAYAALGLLGAAIVLLRVLSGTHWITDVIGSALLSSALLVLFGAGLCIFTEEKQPLPQ